MNPLPRKERKRRVFFLDRFFFSSYMPPLGLLKNFFASSKAHNCSYYWWQRAPDARTAVAVDHIRVVRAEDLDLPFPYRFFLRYRRRLAWFLPKHTPPPPPPRKSKHTSCTVARLGPWKVISNERSPMSFVGMAAKPYQVSCTLSILSPLTPSHR